LLINSTAVVDELLVAAVAAVAASEKAFGLQISLAASVQ